MTFRTSHVFALLAPILISVQASLAQAPAKPGALSVEAGAQVFTAHCARCHGAKGEGTTGPALTFPKLQRAGTDDLLFRIIYFGIGGTEMPSHFGLTEAELKQVALYVRSLAAKTEPVGPGNPFSGDRVYRAAGCNKCHTMDGSGGLMGPDLSGVGLRRNPAFLRAALVEPGSFLPDGFLLVRAVTKDGKAIAGIRLSEDTFSIRLRSASGDLYGFWKEDLKDLQREPTKSPMPSYKGTLTDAQIDDLGAYLMTRKEAK